MSNAQLAAADDRNAALRSEYSEVNQSFRTLTEIRFRLLAFLPISLAAGALLTTNAHNGSPSDWVSGRTAILCLFGIVVTLALASYNARNDQIYVWLVSRAASIERELGLFDGAFANRPYAWFELRIFNRNWEVGHVTSIAAVYVASIAVLLFGLIASLLDLAWTNNSPPPWAYCAALLVAIVLPMRAQQLVSRNRKRRRKNMRDGLKTSLALVEHGFPKNEEARRSLADACSALGHAGKLSSVSEDELFDRIDYYSSLNDLQLETFLPFDDDKGLVTNAHRRLALLVDLPAQWIADIPQRRRNAMPFASAGRQQNRAAF